MRKDDIKMLLGSLIFAVPLAISSLYFGFMQDRPFIGAVLGIASLFGWAVASDALKGLKEKAPDKMKVKFYEECRNNNVEDFSNERDLQRAKLIAEKMHLEKIKNLEKYYLDGKKLHEEEEKAKLYREQRDTLTKLKNREKELYDEYTKYAEYYGRDKRIAILKDKAASLSDKAYRLEKGMELNMRASQQKEIDWATHGGIASGLAGGAAGVAVAIDAQIKNMEIRARNEEVYRSLLPASLMIEGSVSDLRKKASEIMNLVEASKIKLLGNNSASELIENIGFSNIKVNISDTGAFEVETTVSEKKAIKIFDDIEAVIDGTIAAELHQNGKKVGSALLVLPTFGLSGHCQLKGICLSGAEKEQPYEIKFAPYHLWAMEK